MHERIDRELSGESPKHAEELRESDCGGEPAVREPVRSKKDRTRERKGRSRALQRTTDLSRSNRAKPEQDTASGDAKDACRDRNLGAVAVKRRARNKAKYGVGVEVEA